MFYLCFHDHACKLLSRTLVSAFFYLRILGALFTGFSPFVVLSFRLYILKHTSHCTHQPHSLIFFFKLVIFAVKIYVSVVSLITFIEVTLKEWISSLTEGMDLHATYNCLPTLSS